MLPMNRFYQVAYVTRNLEKGIELLRRDHGVRDVLVFEPDMVVQTPSGMGPSKLRAALAWTGPLQIELIQPVSGLIGIYTPYLPADDESLGFHHVCARTDDLAGLLAEIERERITIAYRGGVEGLEFVYLDTRKALGHYLEYMWATPEMWKATGYPGQTGEAAA